MKSPAGGKDEATGAEKKIQSEKDLDNKGIEFVTIMEEESGAQATTAKEWATGPRPAFYCGAMIANHADELSPNETNNIYIYIHTCAISILVAVLSQAESMEWRKHYEARAYGIFIYLLVFVVL